MPSEIDVLLPELDPADIMTIFDIDADQDKLYKGETPEGIEEKCLQLCIDYIGEHWSKLTINDVHVRRITGGLVNQFYRVTIPNCQLMPNDVGVKMYQEKPLKDSTTDDRGNDIIVLKAISDLGIGPKIYGLSNNVAIFDFIESEYFGIEQQKDKKMVRELMKCLAIFHQMKLPTIKNGTFPHTTMVNFLDKAYDKLNMKQIAKEMGLEYLGNMCLRKEFAAIADILENKLKAKRVFCHHDFRSQNILVSKVDSSIKLCDIEFACYGYRSTDLCGLLMEWQVGPLKYRVPSDEIINYVVGVYIEECEKLEPGFSKKPENSLKQISAEIKVTFLRECIFIAGFFLGREDSFLDTMEFDYKESLKTCEKTMESYVRAKKKFIDEGIFQQF